MFRQTPADARATYATVIDDAVARIRANRVEQQALWAALQEISNAEATRGVRLKSDTEKRTRTLGRPAARSATDRGVRLQSDTFQL